MKTDHAKKVFEHYGVKRLLEERLECMKKLEYNWDGHKSSKPNHKSIENAFSKIGHIVGCCELLGMDLGSITVSADEDGYIVIEAWNTEHKVTFDVSPNCVSILWLEVDKFVEGNKV